MDNINGNDSTLNRIKSSKVVAFETVLQQCLSQFRDIMSEFEQMHIESEINKTQYITQKEKCESKCCDGAEELTKIITKKDEIIQSVASTLAKLYETKDLNIVSEAFKILCQDSSPLTPPTEKDEITKISPKKELEMSITEEVSFNESLSEIDGTPTGRTSPIIHTKKTKSLLGKSSDNREKKKTPDDWPTPNSKVVKLTYKTPSRSKGSKLKQSRINVIKLKQTTVVDLTSSPEFSVGNIKREHSNIQSLIKKESFENEDTILPSPTSGPTNFTLYKSKTKDSPIKFKKPPLSLKPKVEKMERQNENMITNKIEDNEKYINILNRIPEGVLNKKKENVEIKMEPLDADATHCETQASVSLLEQVDKLEQQYKQQNCKSPTKRPLGENKNIVNTPTKEDPESSISILQRKNVTTNTVGIKRQLSELAEPICIEPTVRKKAEKRALPGWSCEECENFYGYLYKDDPVMLARKIEECSRHRGRHNPVRPNTPPNFWNPRWTVPQDTEELNRMNNAT